MKPIRLLAALIPKFNSIASRLQTPLLLIIRIYWGWQFFLTGKGKLMNFDRTVDFFTSIGIPLPRLNALMAASTECFGGLLLMAGLLSRLVSLPLAITMIVAYATTEQESLGKLFRHANVEDFLKADPFQFLLAALLVLAFGPGKIALDTLLGRCGDKIQLKPEC